MKEVTKRFFTALKIGGSSLYITNSTHITNSTYLEVNILLSCRSLFSHGKCSWTAATWSLKVPMPNTHT